MIKQEKNAVIKQKSKAVLLQEIHSERRQLEKVIAGLSKDDMTHPGVIGEWSIKDILAHLTAWEQLFLIWYGSGLQGRLPDPPPVGMSKKAIDRLNQEIFNQWSLHSLEDVLSEFQSSYRQVLAAVMDIPEDDMFTPGRYDWTGKLTLADYIAGNTCNHYRWAKTKIRDWLKAHQPI